MARMLPGGLSFIVVEMSLQMIVFKIGIALKQHLDWLSKFYSLNMKDFILFSVWFLIGMPLCGQIRLTVEEDVVEFSLRADSLRIYYPHWRLQDTIDRDCKIIMERIELEQEIQRRLWINLKEQFAERYPDRHPAYKYFKMDTLGILLLECQTSYAEDISFSIRLFLINTNKCEEIYYRFLDNKSYATKPDTPVDLLCYWRLNNFRFAISNNYIKCFVERIIPSTESEQCIFIFNFKTKNAWYAEDW